MKEHLTSIVAIDEEGAIGCKNRLPWSIKSDMAFFRKMTIGNTVIMGRKTYDSIGGCLKERTNLVLSHSTLLFSSTETCKLVNSIDETLATALASSTDETFVIGGAATYAEFAPFVDQYLVTIVEHRATDADAFLSRAIMTEFRSWAGQEIGWFPAEPGKDEYAFRIMRYSAPDALERAQQRRALASRHLEKRLNQPSKSGYRRTSPPRSNQEAFSF